MPIFSRNVRIIQDDVENGSRQLSAPARALRRESQQQSVLLANQSNRWIAGGDIGDSRTFVVTVTAQVECDAKT